ncbi:protein FD-like [Lolium rigidum]|uniref:protein FD-like n=1 Tax=Lolium rigidum TaxID=89674 RepID=UPI001F5D6F55|nr:protein FD-like [Lolium rigidum]
MSDDDAAGSPRLSLSGFSSLFSISTTTPHPHHHHHHDLPPPSLSLSIGTGGEEHEEDQVVSSGQGTTARVRMMKNRESALRSRARKRAYVQELEKEVRRLADDTLRLKRQFRQVRARVLHHCPRPSPFSSCLLLVSLRAVD